MFGFERRSNHSDPIEETTFSDEGVNVNDPAFDFHGHILFPEKGILVWRGSLDRETFEDRVRNVSKGYDTGDGGSLTVHDGSAALHTIDIVEEYMKRAGDIFRHRGVIPLYAIETSVGAWLPENVHYQANSPWGLSKEIKEEILHMQVISNTLKPLRPLLEHAQSERFQIQPWLDMREFLQLVNQDDVIITANHLDHNSELIREMMSKMCGDFGWFLELPTNLVTDNILSKLGISLPPREQRRAKVDFFGVDALQERIDRWTCGGDTHMVQPGELYNIKTRVRLKDPDVSTPHGFWGLKQALKKGDMYVDNSRVFNYLRELGWDGIFRDLKRDPDGDRELALRIQKAFAQDYVHREGQIWGPLGIKEFAAVLGWPRALVRTARIDKSEMVIDARAAVERFGTRKALDYGRRLMHATPGKRVPFDEKERDVITDAVFVGGFLEQRQTPYAEQLARLGIRSHYVDITEPTLNMQLPIEEYSDRSNGQANIFRPLAEIIEERIRNQVQGGHIICVGFSTGGTALLHLNSGDKGLNIQRIVACSAPLAGDKQLKNWETNGFNAYEQIPPHVRDVIRHAIWVSLEKSRLAKKFNIDKAYLHEDVSILKWLFESYHMGVEGWRNIIEQLASNDIQVGLIWPIKDHTLWRFGAQKTIDNLLCDTPKGLSIRIFEGDGNKHCLPSFSLLWPLMLCSPEQTRSSDERNLMEQQAFQEYMKLRKRKKLVFNK